MMWNQGAVLARCLGVLLESGPRERGLSRSMGEGPLMEKKCTPFIYLFI